MNRLFSKFGAKEHKLTLNDDSYTEFTPTNHIIEPTTYDALSKLDNQVIIPHSSYEIDLIDLIPYIYSSMFFFMIRFS